MEFAPEGPKAIPLWIKGHAFLTVTDNFLRCRQSAVGEALYRVPLCGAPEAAEAVASARNAQAAGGAGTAARQAALAALAAALDAMPGTLRNCCGRKPGSPRTGRWPRWRRGRCPRCAGPTSARPASSPSSLTHPAAGRLCRRRGAGVARGRDGDRQAEPEGAIGRLCAVRTVGAGGMAGRRPQPDAGRQRGDRRLVPRCQRSPALCRQCRTRRPGLCHRRSSRQALRHGDGLMRRRLFATSRLTRHHGPCAARLVINGKSS